MSAQSTVHPRPYARFTRRLRGSLFDFMVFLMAPVIALQVTVAFESRVIGFAFIAGFFLYEPLLVAFADSTIGHYLCNLRVVDAQTHGNIGFPKAFARVAIKTVLRWYSFISMTATRRHQAVHDILTRSTVQIRDPSKAQPYQYSHERIDLSNRGMPSRGRHILVIAAYLAASYLVLELVIFAGLLSKACLKASSSDDLFLMSVLVGIALCIGLGWRGRLWGPHPS
jgi:uncharacterized RDD family membrane protein YckC